MNNQDTKFNFAFIDESGGINTSKGNHFIVIAALCTQNTAPIGRLIKQTKKNNKHSSKSRELKGSSESSKVKHSLLQKLSKKSVQIYSLIIDNAVLKYPPKDPEDIYRLSAARLINNIFHEHQLNSIYLDKRYTNIDLRNQLENTIRNQLSKQQNEGVSIFQEDSASKKELQVIDIVAWSLFQKYENNNLEFYNHLPPIHVSEEYISKHIWDHQINIK